MCTSSGNLESRVWNLLVIFLPCFKKEEPPGSPNCLHRAQSFQLGMELHAYRCWCVIWRPWLKIDLLRRPLLTRFPWQRHHVFHGQDSIFSCFSSHPVIIKLSIKERLGGFVTSAVIGTNAFFMRYDIIKNVYTNRRWNWLNDKYWRDLHSDECWKIFQSALDQIRVNFPNCRTIGK